MAIATSLVSWCASTAALGQSLEQELAALRERGRRESWTFTIGQTSASQRPLEQLCGLIVPENWWVGAPFDPGGSRLALPAAFDWREQGGCTSVRDQGNCGSCWAFATIGPLECNILIHDSVTVDLAEQWLVSCNSDGYSCSGGWFAHEYHESATDPCGDSGAVLEADFPYAAVNLSCACPYDHPYAIDGWSYIGSSAGVPSVDAIKQAIMDHGPVSAAVYVNSAFQNYTGGVFNGCSSFTVNHAVVLVGWDDAQGTEGIWILRNSWGPNWGEDGYMLIEYGCSSIGYAACYVEYAGLTGPRLEVTPAALDFGDIAVGGSDTQTFRLKNVGGETLSGSASGLGTPFSIEGQTDYTLTAGQTLDMTVRFAPELQGTFECTVSFTGGGGASRSVSGHGTGSGPSNTCAGATTVSDGTFTGSNIGANTSTSASCGGGGTADVWWKYTAAQTGVAAIDTCGSDFDTVLSVYDTCEGTELECNDDYNGCTGNPTASQVTFSVNAGAAYYLRVAGTAATTGNIVLNIETTVPKRTISGRVTTNDGTGVAGVSITGLPDEPATNDSGYYTAEVDYGFSGTATPHKTAYTFSPASRSYTDVTIDRTDEDYNATPPSFTILGCVTDENGSGIAGVKMTGLSGTPVTGLSGKYQATVSLGFNGVATPTRTACTFDPPTRSYESVSSDLLFENYVGHQQTGSLMVVLEPAAARDAGALWQVDGGNWHSSGETVTGLPVGRHTVSCTAVSRWTAPLSDIVTIEHAQTTTLTSTYTQQSYKLTLAVQPAGTGALTAAPSPNPDDRYAQDTVVALTATPQTGFQVQGWIGADEFPASGSATNTVTVDTHRSVIVQFEVEPFCVYQLSALVRAGEGWVEPARGAYREGETVTLIAAPAPGSQVKAWTGTDDDTSTQTINAVTMNGYKTVTVEFETWPDCNSDGVSDRDNIAAGTSMDLNGNDVPDECEPGDGGSDADELVDAVPPPPVGLCGIGLVETAAFSLVGLAFLRRGSASNRRVPPPAET